MGKNWNVDGLLDENRDCWHFHQLLHHLQHRSIESRDELVPDACVPLHIPLRPPLSKRSRPSCELTTLVVRQRVVHGGRSLRGRSLPGLGREVRCVLLTLRLLAVGG